MIRLAVSFSAALLFSIALMFGLKQSVEVKQDGFVRDDNLKMIDFVRIKREERLAKKERPKPKRKKPEKPLVTPKVAVNKPQKPQQPKRQTLQPLALNLPVNLSASSALGDALVGSFDNRIVNANVAPLVRIDPIYPRRARMMKKEGFVKYEFTITKTGTVTDVVVVESEPARIFDRAGKRALTKWKFKPKMEEGQPVEQRASVKFDFRLDQ